MADEIGFKVNVKPHASMRWESGRDPNFFRAGAPGYPALNASTDRSFRVGFVDNKKQEFMYTAIRREEQLAIRNGTITKARVTLPLLKTRAAPPAPPADSAYSPHYQTPRNFEASRKLGSGINKGYVDYGLSSTSRAHYSHPKQYSIPDELRPAFTDRAGGDNNRQMGALTSYLNDAVKQVVDIKLTAHPLGPNKHGSDVGPGWKIPGQMRDIDLSVYATQ